MAPRKPLTKSIHAWFCGTRAAGFRQRLICPVTGKTFNARPIKHPIRAMTAKGIVLHAWLSKNIATPTYVKTNVSASVASTFQILGHLATLRGEVGFGVVRHDDAAEEDGDDAGKR